MISLIVTYVCKPGMRDAFLQCLKKERLAEASRAEEGNLRYLFTCSEDEPDNLYLLEKWENMDAVERHMKQPHFSRITEIKAKYVLNTLIEKYE